MWIFLLQPCKECFYLFGWREACDSINNNQLVSSKSIHYGKSHNEWVEMKQEKTHICHSLCIAPPRPESAHPELFLLSRDPECWRRGCAESPLAGTQDSYEDVKQIYLHVVRIMTQNSLDICSSWTSIWTWQAAIILIQGAATETFESHRYRWMKTLKLNIIIYTKWTLISR